MIGCNLGLHIHLLEIGKHLGMEHIFQGNAKNVECEHGDQEVDSDLRNQGGIVNEAMPGQLSQKLNYGRADDCQAGNADHDKSKRNLSRADSIVFRPVIPFEDTVFTDRQGKEREPGRANRSKISKQEVGFGRGEA